MTEMKKHSVHSMQEPPPRARIVQVVTEASGRISQVLGEATHDIVALFRPELAAAGKILGALSAAVIGVFLVAFFASIALLGFLAASCHSTGQHLSWLGYGRLFPSSLWPIFELKCDGLGLTAISLLLRADTEPPALGKLAARLYLTQT